MNSLAVDRLVLLTLFSSQSGPLLKQLSAENFRFTLINNAGGLVQEASICLLIGFSHERMPLFLDIVRNHCRRYRNYIPAQTPLSEGQMNISMVEALMGGAAVFMMNVERFEQV